MTQVTKQKSTLLYAVGLLLAALLHSSLVSADISAIAAFEQNDLKQAKARFIQVLEKNDKDPVALHYLGKIAMREGEWDDAEEFIEKAIVQVPRDASVHFDAAQIMGAQAQNSSIFSAPGYAKKALKGFRKAAELEPEKIDYHQGLMSFYLQAPGFLGGDEKLALQEAQAIAKLDKLEGIIAMANIYQNNEEFDKLNGHYQSATEKYPDSARLFFNRGMYYQTQEKFDLAIIDFSKASLMKAKDDEDTSVFAALYQLGRSSVLSGIQIEQGIQSLQIFIDLAPRHDNLPSKPWAKYRLGLLFAKKGDRTTARDFYKQAMAETKDKRLLKNLKKELKKKR